MVQISVFANRFRGEDQRNKTGLQSKLRQNFVVWMSVSANGFRSEDQKKRSSLQNLRLCMTFTQNFILERKFAYTWGEHKQCSWGAQAPKSTTGHQACQFVLGQNPYLEGRNSCFRGHKQ